MTERRTDMTRRVKSTMLLTGTIVPLLFAAAAPEPKSISVQELLFGKATITGFLGVPLGTYVTIEGTRPDQLMKIRNAMTVDTLDGKKLAAPVTIEIDGVEELPAGTRCIFRGYETGAMVSSPIDPLAKRDSVPQQNFHFSSWFDAIQIKQPANLNKARFRLP
jgi:hypothetical protein